MKEVTLHLITQDNQPYGSVRKCCEKCGAMTEEGMTFTSDHQVYENPPTDGPKYVRCQDVN
ncbi:hypothetical protein [Neptuniibacter sp. QD37_11]|uniref:hypothetical protein n=1 Tax=Neptuniibacter sp. QD37_11 TaxID=3398209 RepID=UPI0039F4F10C